jgi:hypothetical protein
MLDPGHSGLFTYVLVHSGLCAKGLIVLSAVSQAKKSEMMAQVTAAFGNKFAQIGKQTFINKLRIHSTQYSTVDETMKDE